MTRRCRMRFATSHGCIDTLRFTGFAPSLLDGCRREPRHLHVQLSRGPRFRSNIHGHSPFHFTYSPTIPLSRACLPSNQRIFVHFLTGS